MRSACEWWGESPELDQGRWEQNMRTCTHSARGQQLLREVREALDTLPSKRLAKGALRVDGDVCVVGAWMLTKRGCNVAELPTGDDDECLGYGGLDASARAAANYGMTYTLAYMLADLNDEILQDWTPEARWKAVRAWVSALIYDEKPSDPSLALSNAVRAATRTRYVCA